MDDDLRPFSVSRQNAWLVLKIFTIVLRLVIRRFYLSVSPPHRHPPFAGECFVRNLIQCHNIAGNRDTSSAIDTAFGTACGFATGGQLPELLQLTQRLPDHGQQLLHCIANGFRFRANNHLNSLLFSFTTPEAPSRLHIASLTRASQPRSGADE